MESHLTLKQSRFSTFSHKWVLTHSKQAVIATQSFVSGSVTIISSTVTKCSFRSDHNFYIKYTNENKLTVQSKVFRKRLSAEHFMSVSCILTNRPSICIYITSSKTLISTVKEDEMMLFLKMKQKWSRPDY